MVSLNVLHRNYENKTTCLQTGSISNTAKSMVLLLYYSNNNNNNNLFQEETTFDLRSLVYVGGESERCFQVIWCFTVYGVEYLYSFLVYYALRKSNPSKFWTCIHCL